MKRFYNRMICALYLAGLSSFVYAAKNFTARNATAVVQLAAVVSNITIKNGTDNLTLVSPHRPKHQKPKLKTWLQSRVNGSHTLANTTTSRYRGQPSSGEYPGKKGGRKKSAKKTKEATDISRSGIKAADSRNPIVDECFYQPLLGKQTAGKHTAGKHTKGYRLHSRSAHHGYALDKGVSRGTAKENSLAGANDIPVNQAGLPMTQRSVPTIKQRSTSGQPSTPLGNANFTIVGQSHDGHFHLVEPVDLNGVHTPFYKQLCLSGESWTAGAMLLLG